jgi:hypothetical protein
MTTMKPAHEPAFERHHVWIHRLLRNLQTFFEPHEGIHPIWRRVPGGNPDSPRLLR